MISKLRRGISYELNFIFKFNIGHRNQKSVDMKLLEPKKVDVIGQCHVLTLELLGYNYFRETETDNDKMRWSDNCSGQVANITHRRRT